MPSRSNYGAPPLVLTPALRLRAYRASDAARLAKIAGVDSIARNTFGIPLPYLKDAAAMWIEGLKARFETNQERVYAIELNGQLVGSIALVFEWEHLRAEIGYWVGEDFRGQGVATTALKRMTELGFALGLKRIYGMVFVENLGSIQVLQRSGYKREGKLKKHIHKWGQQRDVWVYARTV